MNYHRQNVTFQFTEDPSKRNAQVTGIIYREVLLLMKFSKNKFQVKKINIYYYDLYYTVTKNRNEEELTENKIDYDNKNFHDNFIKPN